MAEIESTEIIGAAPAEAPAGGQRHGTAVRTQRTVRVLAALLGVALAAVAALAVLLVGAQRRDVTTAGATTPDRRAAVAAVTAWAQAVDRHDLDGVDAITVPDAGVLVIASEGVLDRPFAGRRFIDGGRLTFAPDVRLRLLDQPRAVQDLQVTLTAALTFGGRTETEQTVVNLERRGVLLKVSAVVMTTVPTDRLPSEA